jgi:hypothetical protein
MHKVESEQEVNDSPSALLNGDGHLSSAKASKQAPEPTMQCFRLLFQNTAFHQTGIRCLQANGMFATSPVQTNPSCVIGSFGFHLSTPLCAERGLWSDAIIMEESSEGMRSTAAVTPAWLKADSAVPNGESGQCRRRPCIDSVGGSFLLT